jgi:aryl-alcohol dehydrogenase-like predicted oxidoreductase
MNKRSLGNTGFEVSEIGLGAWQIGADWGVDVPIKTALEALHVAADAGVNFIDTADVYGAGRSEKIIGEFIKERNDRIIVATKMGRATSAWNDSYEEIAKAAELSCNRLGVSSLDLVQLHCIPEETLHNLQAFENLEKIKQEGLIKNYGVSVETIEEGIFCIENSSASSLQVIFNIFRQRVVKDLLNIASSNNVGIIARVPLASGLLSGKFSKEHQFAESDHRNFNSDGQLFNVGETFAGVPFDLGIEFANEVEGILSEDLSEATLAQKSLRWILDHDEISTVIPGATTSKQAAENAEVSAMKSISSKSYSNLKSLYDEKIDSRVRGRY